MRLLTVLERRVQRDGSRPLLTWYDTATGARTEFSAVTWANWVDKTGHLLEDQGLDAGGTVALPVLLERPGHWVGLVWALATWARGAAVHVVADARAGDADVAVVGPRRGELSPSLPPARGAAAWVACSLHPLGLGLSQPLPGALDYREVLGHPDLHLPAEPSASPLLVDQDGVWEDADLMVEPISDRVVLVARDHRQVLRALAGVVLGGGSLVLVEGEPDDPMLAALAEAERARVLSP